MPRNVKDIVRKLPPARRKKIKTRAKQLVTEETTRQELRVALNAPKVRQRVTTLA